MRLKFETLPHTITQFTSVKYPNGQKIAEHKFTCYCRILITGSLYDVMLRLGG